MSATAPKGLQDVVANESSICFIDGGKGILSYRGIDIHELAQKSTFEETTYLLWRGALPTAPELEEFSQHLAAARELPPDVLDFLGRVPKTALPMEVLRTAVSLLSIYDEDELSVQHAANLRKSFRLTAQIATIVAVFDRIRKGKPVVKPKYVADARGELSMDVERREALRDRDPGAGRRADPPCRPAESTSAPLPRAIAATPLLDMHSAIPRTRCNRGRRRAPLHGGANEAVTAPARRGIDRPRRPGGARSQDAGEQGEDLRLRASRLHYRRPTCDPPAQDERGTGQGR